MKENKIKVIINRPISEVFEFTTNPKNTHMWIPSIEKEITNEYPPKLGTIYKNHGEDENSWDEYKVIEFENNKVFTLEEVGGTYKVRYSYKQINENTTELEYFEWVSEGVLNNSFPQSTLNLLKEFMEK